MRGWSLSWLRAARRGGAQVAAAFVLLAFGAEARAGDFLEDGSFYFDPASVARFDFEDGVPEPSDPRDPPLTRIEVSDALSENWVIEIAPFADAFVSIDLPDVVRTYRASLWVRGGDSAGFAVIAHEDGRAAEVAVLYPTGRVTSDGWVELANQGIRVDGARSGLGIGIFSPEGGQMDAIELVADGEIDGLNPSCFGALDDACGVGEVCYWGECRNVNGWVPPIPSDREAVTLYLENRLRFLFGPFLERTIDLPGALIAVEAMRHASDPWSYWNGYALAVRRLHDGHTAFGGLADFVLDNPKPLSICFLEGDADLSHATEPSDPDYHDVLVSHVGGDHNLGLAPGDRLVRIDGLHPIEWSRMLVEVNWNHPTAANHQTFAEHASQLRAAISRFASEIEVIRCNAQSASCGAVEVISIRDLPMDAPGTPVSSVACDNRPLRHVPGAPFETHAGDWDAAYSGLLLESNTTEKIYGIEWESLFTSNGQDGVGANLNAGIQLLENDAARGVILDHRTGTGGTLAGPEIIWDFAVTTHPVSFMQTRQRAEDEQPTLAQGLAIFQLAVSQGHAEKAGSSNPSSIPIALLITQDVSASDWLPLGLKGAAPNVRIFGPYATSGSFSTFHQLGYWLGFNMGLASADTYLPDGSTTNGTGVEPDIVVLPKQSDLLVGKDTVFEAALAWIRAELGP